MVILTKAKVVVIVVVTQQVTYSCVLPLIIYCHMPGLLFSVLVDYSGLKNEYWFALYSSG